MAVDSVPETLSPKEVGEKVASLSREKKEPSALREQVNELLTKNGLFHNATANKDVAKVLEQSQVLPRVILIEFGSEKEITKEALEQKLANSQNAFEEFAAQSLLDRFDSVNGINARLNKGADNNPVSIDATELNTYASQGETTQTTTDGNTQTTDGNIEKKKEVWGERGREFGVAADGSAEYTVKPKDTLWAIASDALAKRQNLKPGEQPKIPDILAMIDEIAKANPEIKNRDLIHPSQVVKIPAESKGANNSQSESSKDSKDSTTNESKDTTGEGDENKSSSDGDQSGTTKTDTKSDAKNDPPTNDANQQPERKTKGQLADGKTCEIGYDENGKVSKVIMDEGGALIRKNDKWYQYYDANNSVPREDIKDVTIDQATGVVTVHTA